MYLFARAIATFSILISAVAQPVICQTLRAPIPRGARFESADSFGPSHSGASVTGDSAPSHRRAAIIGATAGALIGGLGTAAYILNALAPDCVGNVSATVSGPTVVSSHNCNHRHRIVVFETVTIAAGAAAGAWGGAWLARRIARWSEGRHHTTAP